ncbi:MarR family winged helix-turn-helix transcriptional regulator [Rhodococcus sp. NPDC003318]|uniref:MarR family winged helix-turn-helix transcriptional regulator n=1 Tax=Rhodococcus sp. NPDC003318 TaxID=3364503 RepID=UPI00368D2D0E
MATEIADETAASPHWLDAAEMRAWRGFIEGSQRLMEVLNRELQSRHQISLADYRILVILSESPDGSVRMSELADGILSSRSRLTHQVRRMETDDLVTRSTCVEDGRGVLALITPHGRSKLAEAAPTHLNGVRNYLIDLLDAKELDAVGTVFEKVDAALDARPEV